MHDESQAFRFCPRCGAPLERRLLKPTEPERLCCTSGQCGFVFYLDPKIAVDLHIPRRHVETAIDPATLDRYAGTYKYSDTDIVVVTRDGDHLVESENGQDKLALFAEGPRDFFFKAADAQVTFETGADGKVAAAIWHQDGQDQRGVRVP